jgi:acetyl esterase/lipase
MFNESAAGRHVDVRAAATLLIIFTLVPLGWMAATPAAAQTVDAVDIAPEVVLDDRYPERRTVFSNGVASLADVVYAVHVGYRPLVLDLYLPPDAGRDATRYPLVVAVHGGGWQSGHTRHSGAFANWPAALAAIANDGFVVASVEYRLSKEAPFPAAFDDVRDAIRWLRAHAADYGIDKHKVVVMGGSAGGQLVGLVGTACGDTTNPSAPFDADPVDIDESACVQGVVAWYGVFDFGSLVATTAGGAPVPDVLGRYLGCGDGPCSPDTVRAASAIDWVDADDPPFLLIHGVDDPVVSIEQSRRMHTALEDAGVPATLIEIPGVKHSFIGATPEATINASRKAWDSSIAFIRNVLRDSGAGDR